MSNHLIDAAGQLHRHYKSLITGNVHPVQHPVAKGDAREHGWRTLLSRFLPDLYGVKSGFIVDSDGAVSKQIDCIVYRQDMATELYSVGFQTVVPVEVVLGAFEIKPSIDRHTLADARQKAESIAAMTVSNFMSLEDNGRAKVVTGTASGAVVMGLLADDVAAKTKWATPSFRQCVGKVESHLDVFMTVNDGCVDTLSTGLPSSSYRHFEGESALLQELICLTQAFDGLARARHMTPSSLSAYRRHLKAPKIVAI